MTLPSTRALRRYHSTIIHQRTAVATGKGRRRCRLSPGSDAQHVASGFLRMVQRLIRRRDHLGGIDVPVTPFGHADADSDGDALPRQAAPGFPFRFLFPAVAIAYRELGRLDRL